MHVVTKLMAAMKRGTPERNTFAKPAGRSEKVTSDDIRPAIEPVGRDIVDQKSIIIKTDDEAPTRASSPAWLSLSALDFRETWQHPRRCCMSSDSHGSATSHHRCTASAVVAVDPACVARLGRCGSRFHSEREVSEIGADGSVVDEPLSNLVCSRSQNLHRAVGVLDRPVKGVMTATSGARGDHDGWPQACSQSWHWSTMTMPMSRQAGTPSD